MEANEVIDFFWWPFTESVWARKVNPAKTGCFGALGRHAGRLRIHKSNQRKILDATQVAFGGAVLQVWALWS